jgi:1-deoxy-D-xylulose-5-phosphate reductoisomerase
MKKKIAILGSTGSIGKTLLDIISKDRKNFEIILLTADRNYKLLYKQAKNFNVKNLIITDTKKYNLLKKISKKKNLNIYNDFKSLAEYLKVKLIIQ